MHQWAQITRIGSTTVVVEFLPQHAYFVSPVAAQLRDRMEIKLAPLSEHDRDRSRFEEAVVGRVADGVSDLVVGLPPKSMAKLEKIPLYTSRLEAMIRDLGDESPDHLTLDEVAQHDLLLPPSAARSRELLEKALAEGLKETGTPTPFRLSRRTAPRSWSRSARTDTALSSFRPTSPTPSPRATGSADR